MSGVAEPRGNCLNPKCGCQDIRVFWHNPSQKWRCAECMEPAQYPIPAVEEPPRVKLTPKQKVTKLRETLLLLQKERYHEPDSDSREYCAGCHRSPYNVPPHTDECLVVLIAKVLDETA